MSIAVGSRSAIGHVVETTLGTTPTTPVLLELPFTGFNVGVVKDKYIDQSIQGDRMYRPSVAGNTHIGGDLDVNYAPLHYDALLESLLSGVWVTNVLKIGNTRKSFTVEHSQIDIAQFFQYNGMIVDKLQLKIATNGIITAKFTFVGKDSPTVTTVSVDVTAGTAPNGFYTAPVVSLPFVHNGGTFKEGGSTFADMMSLDLTIENKTSSNFVLGSNTIRDFSQNFLEITGTAQVYVEDATIYNKFINATSTSLDFTLTNGTNTHEFNLPNIRYHGASKSVAGNGPVTLSLPFVGFYDSTASSNIVITKT